MVEAKDIHLVQCLWQFCRNSYTDIAMTDLVEIHQSALPELTLETYGFEDM